MPLQGLPLLRDRRFWPLFLTQFLGAFNDNLFKNALVILILFQLAAEAGLPGALLVTAAAGLFILPFFLFSATAGRWADAAEKSRLIRSIKLAELVIMMVGAAGLIFGEITFLLATLFAMGAQSALFGPIKYGVLPQLLDPEELISGNAMINAATFLAILLGTLAGGLLVTAPNGPIIVGIGVVLTAFVGWGASRYIGQLPAGAPDMRVGWDVHRHIADLMGELLRTKSLRRPVLAISWFWFVGATYLAQFPAFGRDVLGVDEVVVTLFLTMFTIGIGMGALICAKVMKQGVSDRLAPWAALGLAVFSADLFWCGTEALNGGEIVGVLGFLDTVNGYRILADLFGLAVCGGLYIVPFYALLQLRAEPSRRSRVIAGLNIVNALFMVMSSLLAMAAFGGGAAVPDLFAGLAVGSVLVAVWMWLQRSSKQGES